jgi:putative spermidine/putrescine transport system permease protein
MTSAAIASRAKAPAERSQAGAAATFLAPATLAVLLMLVAPLLLLVRFSVNRFDATDMMIEMVTAENYLRFFSDPFYLSVLRTTLFVAVSSTALCLLLGLPMAYTLARMQSRWKSACMLAIVLPLFVGSTVRMVGWMILFARGGMIDSTLRMITGHGFELMYTTTAVVAGVVSINLPFVVLTIQSSIETIDTRIEEAAQSLGAPPSRCFWRVVWPLALPGTAIAGILCDERLCHAVSVGRAAIPDDGAAAVLGIRHQQQLAVRLGPGVDPDGHNAFADRLQQSPDPEAIQGLTSCLVPSGACPFPAP